MKLLLSYRASLVLIALMLLITPAAQAQTPSKLEVVRMAYVPVLIYAPVYIGFERGYFAQEGIDLQLTPQLVGSDSGIQLSTGAFDAAVGGIGAGLLNAISKGLDFRIVAPMHSERPPLVTPLVIAASRKDEIKSVKDLKGKKVAINVTGAASEYWLAEALKRAGLTFKDISLTTIAFKDVAAALQAGAVDAALLGEPLMTMQRDEGLVSVLADDFIDGFTPTYLSLTVDLVNKRPKVAQAMVRAYLRACRDLQGNAFKDPAIAAIVEKYTKVPAKVTQKANHPYYDPNGVIPVKDIMTLQDYFLTRGELEYTTPLDLTKMIDTSLVEQAVKDIGVYAVPTAQATAAQ